MSEKNTDSLHKEFELERIILFSDAVFAIAITLLIIEIKFPELPENYKEGVDLFQLFKPTIGQFLGFIVSFVFIGVSWAKHLAAFRYLKGYDNGLIAYNLLCLIFIVSFPFTASGITHLRSGFKFPMILYLGNIAMVFFTHFLLVHYIFRKKPALCLPGHEAEKKYIYATSRVSALGLMFAFIVPLATAIITNNNNEYVGYSFYAVLPITPLVRFTAKKYRPKKQG